jgi:hypothetical protein
MCVGMQVSGHRVVLFSRGTGKGIGLCDVYQNVHTVRSRQLARAGIIVFGNPPREQ